MVHFGFQWIDKLAHISIEINDSLQKLAEVYTDRIISLQGIPSSIVSDGDMRFT